MIYCNHSSGIIKNTYQIWNISGSTLKRITKTKDIYCSRKLAEINSISCLSTNRPKFIHNSQILTFKKFLPLFFIFFTQMTVPIPSYGLSDDFESVIKSKKLLAPKVKSNFFENRFFSAENILTDNFSCNDIPIIKRASDLLKEMIIMCLDLLRMRLFYY